MYMYTHTHIIIGTHTHIAYTYRHTYKAGGALRGKKEGYNFPSLIKYIVAHRAKGPATKRGGGFFF